MKKFVLFLLLMCATITAMADWSYGTACFRGEKPTQGMTHGNISIWYNGTLRRTHTKGNVYYWEGTGDICVVFPKNYNGPEHQFISTGGIVQIQYLR